MVDHLSKTQTHAKTALAYFYFDYRQQESQIAGFFVTNILRQLVAQLGHLPDCLLDLYERFKLKEARFLELEVSNALREILKLFERCFVIIDAFDECVDGDCRKNILHILDVLDSERLQTFVTTRPHPAEIKNRFQTALRATI